MTDTPYNPVPIRDGVRDDVRSNGPLDTTVRTGPTLTEDAHTEMLNKVSWGAIFAGVVVGLITQVLLTMLGVGIGIGTLDPGTGDNPTGTAFSIGAGIWYVLSGIIAAYIGGYVASRMAGRTQATTDALHGLTTWAFMTLVVLYLLTSAVGGIVGGAFSGVTGALGGMGSTIAQTAAPALANANPLDAIQGEVQASGTDPQALQAKAVNAIRGLVTGDAAGKDQARTQAVQALAQARGIPEDQARTQVADIEKRTNDTIASAKQKATAAADTAASVVSKGSLLAFVALVLGAIAGWLGGRSGVVHPVFADRIVPTRRSGTPTIRS